MRTTPIALLIFAFPLSLGACNRNPPPRAANSGAADDPISQDIKQIEYGVRLAAANKRIDELERKVGALEDTPEKLDLVLLTQRMTALEVQGRGVLAQVPPVAPAADKTRSVVVLPRISGKVSKVPVRAPRLHLPDLEKRDRLATAAEAKAFSTKPRD